jgi:hypothetical protein
MAKTLLPQATEGSEVAGWEVANTTTQLMESYPKSVAYTFK